MVDRTDKRLPCAVFACSLAIAGLSILVTVHEGFPLRYFALLICGMGTSSLISVLTCWYTMGLNGHRERSIGSAWFVSIANISGLIGPFAFLSKDAPNYRLGLLMCLAFMALAVILLFVYTALLMARR